MLVSDYQLDISFPFSHASVFDPLEDTKNGIERKRVSEHHTDLFQSSSDFLLDSGWAVKYGSHFIVEV